MGGSVQCFGGIVTLTGQDIHDVGPERRIRQMLRCTKSLAFRS